MFASRSELSRTRTSARCAPAVDPVLWIAAGFLLFALAVLFVQPAGAATRTHTKATADTARSSGDDEGISVRVIDGGVTKAVKRIHHGSDESVETPDKPDVPDVPEPPEPPDHGDNDLVRFGQDIEIEAGRVVDGSVVALGGNIVVRGEVKGDCTAVGGNVTVEDSALVHGDAVSVGGQTEVLPGGKVMKSVVSVGSGGAWAQKLHGHHIFPWMGLMGVGAAIGGIMNSIVQFLITLLLAWLALLLVRDRMLYAVERMSTHFGKSLLWGLVAWMAAVVAIPAIVIVGAIAMVILVITIIGIPVAILLAIALVFALIGAVLGIVVMIFLGYVNGAIYLGRQILHRWKPGATFSPMHAVIAWTALIAVIKITGHVISLLGLVFLMPIGIALTIACAVLWIVLTTAGMGSMVLTRLAKGPTFATAAPAMGAAPAPPAPTAEAWYSPPPAPPAAPTPPPPAPSRPAAPPPPEGGSSDAP